MNKKRYIIPIFVPHLGCPNDCIFCNQKKITNVKQAVNKDEIHDIIETQMSYFPINDVIKEIAFFGGSFTAIPRKVMVTYLEIAKYYKDRGLINEIRLSTRPDCIDQEILDILNNYGVDIIELGVQSMDDKVLLANNRGHDSHSVVKASKLIRDNGFILGHQLMPGLYMDSEEKTLESARKLISLKPDIVRIYPTLVVKNTPLESLYKYGIYKPLSIEEAAKICAKLIPMFENNGIRVIRVGLQATENINLDNDVVVGPFHPALRQLSEQIIYYNILDDILLKEKDLEGSDIIIKACKSKLSYIVGNKAINKKKIMDKFKLKSIKFLAIDQEKIELIHGDNKIELEI